MEDRSYGFSQQRSLVDAASAHVEEVSIRGYTVIEGVLTPDELSGWRERIDRVYARQEAEMGRETLASINELDAARAPLLYDPEFLRPASHTVVLEVVRRFLGDWFILNLQNAVINRPTGAHHQGAWHRDLPYQNFIISNPLAINALWVIDPFSAETGGTAVLPFSHKLDLVPSDTYIRNNLVDVMAPAGSVVVFDSMLIHRAGTNRSSSVRRALNHLYTTPILKQQYDFPRALADRRDSLDAATQRLLGFTAQVPLDDTAWRAGRLARLAGTAG